MKYIFQHLFHSYFNFFSYQILQAILKKKKLQLRELVNISQVSSSLDVYRSFLFNCCRTKFWGFHISCMLDIWKNNYFNLACLVEYIYEIINNTLKKLHSFKFKIFMKIYYWRACIILVLNYIVHRNKMYLLNYYKLFNFSL